MSLSPEEEACRVFVRHKLILQCLATCRSIRERGSRTNRTCSVILAYSAPTMRHHPYQEQRRDLNLPTMVSQTGPEESLRGTIDNFHFRVARARNFF
jgi:hypothetical protein